MGLLMMQCIPSVALNMCCNCNGHHTHHFECNILARLLPNKRSNHRNQHILKRKKSKTTNKTSDIGIMQTCSFVTQKTQLTLPQPALPAKIPPKKIGIIIMVYTTFSLCKWSTKPGGITDRSHLLLELRFPVSAPNEDLIAEIGCFGWHSRPEKMEVSFKVPKRNMEWMNEHVFFG